MNGTEGNNIARPLDHAPRCCRCGGSSQAELRPARRSGSHDSGGGKASATQSSRQEGSMAAAAGRWDGSCQLCRERCRMGFGRVELHQEGLVRG